MLRVIHHNRWFFWTLALLVMIAMFLVFQIQRLWQEFEDQAREQAAEPALWPLYRSEAFGFLLRYPAGWQVDIDPREAKSFDLENPGSLNEYLSFSVTSAQLEPVIRQSLGITRERSVVVDGFSAAWLFGDNPKDHATRNVVLLAKDHKLYYIAGQSKYFMRIVQSIRFTKPAQKT